MKKVILIGGCFVLLLLSACSNNQLVESSNGNENSGIKLNFPTKEDQWVKDGTETYQDFLLDNILHTSDLGDIHYNVYIPQDYDGNEAYALYFTLPGYQGLYFQGVGENLKTETFGFIARDYQPKMIIVAPQLSDWQENSANQIIALVNYFFTHYNIDRNRVYANGYSGGGQTMSLVVGKRADLFTAYLHVSSQWDGGYESVVANRTPIYIVIGENDEYYGSQSSQEIYDTLYRMYQEEGLTDEKINQLLVLDIKESAYFTSRGITNQHGGGALFAKDEQIMSWLFDKKK